MRVQRIVDLRKKWINELDSIDEKIESKKDEIENEEDEIKNMKDELERKKDEIKGEDKIKYEEEVRHKEEKLSKNKELLRKNEKRKQELPIYINSDGFTAYKEIYPTNYAEQTDKIVKILKKEYNINIPEDCLTPNDHRLGQWLQVIKGTFSGQK
ncbi:uncharacterized protein FOMMEDRAFT_24783 [Fomitiporia mediterranea MF3/22]|uniref:uncharacterized protein n=1 Tax=Fomitiporia mediterranea (strain MF3/22) TaxID=694068 RepID=UPI00044073F6|nr:uncharacterized protein FOMMEDRAFT_24783 [Fomitiporia mediterranea MF3/22]EJD07397.1 hypothetical protein FOMMEDRAFT_24783 [Fomitiporia mediterranea MF3/22]